MAELKITIGGRDFEVSCQDGEEHFLRAAAGMLDAEATALMGMIGRIPEGRMLLMAGLMLADKAAGTDDQLKALEDKVAQQQAWIEELQGKPQPEPTRVEVAVIPDEVTQTLAELAARAEALADAAEEKSAAG